MPALPILAVLLEIVVAAEQPVTAAALKTSEASKTSEVLAAAEPPVTAAAFPPNGKSVVVGSQAGIRVLSWPDLKPISKLETDLVHVHDLAFSPRGDRLLAAGGDPGVDGAVEVFSWPDGKRLKRLADHTDIVYAVDWSPDGKRWASAAGDNVCRVHDASSFKHLVTFDGHSRAVLAVRFTPDGKAVLSAGVDQGLRLWDAADGKSLRALDNHVGPVVGLALRPGTERDTPPVYASASSDRTVRLWQPTIGRLMRFKKLASAPFAVAWTPDGSRLLASCADGRLRVIEPDSLDMLQDVPAGQGWGHTLAVPPPFLPLPLSASGKGLGGGVAMRSSSAVKTAG